MYMCQEFAEGRLDAVPASLADARHLSEEHINLYISHEHHVILSSPFHKHEFADSRAKISKEISE